jgi:hypothetical protein
VNFADSLNPLINISFPKNVGDVNYRGLVPIFICDIKSRNQASIVNIALLSETQACCIIVKQPKAQSGDPVRFPFWSSDVF